MATVAVATDTVNQYIHRLTVTVVGQDVVANTSRVRYAYTVENTGPFSNGSWTTLNSVTFHAVVNGTDHSAATNFDFRNSPRTVTMLSGEQTISHTTDGSKSINIRLYCNALPSSIWFFAADSGTVSFPITPIPRASTFTATPNPVIEGGDITVDITRANSGFTHTVAWESGASSATVGTGIATTATWTPNPALLGANTRVPVTVTVTTFNGATQIGSPVSKDIIFKTAPVYPEVGLGTPYDLRFRRTEMDGSDWVVREVIPFLEADTVDTLSASGACNLTVATGVYDTPLDEAVVVADFYDGSQWLDTGLVYVLTRVQTDDTDMTGTVTYNGISYVDYLLSKTVLGPGGADGTNREWTNRNPGYILSGMLLESHNRGWGPLVEASFDDTATSFGTPWGNTTTLKLTRNTPVSQVLDGLVSDALVEYQSRFDASDGLAYLELFNPGYGEDWTTTGADPIINLGTAGMFKVVDAAPVRKDFSEKLTRVFVTGDESTSVREKGSEVNPLFGHLEGSVSATGVTTPAELNKLGDAVLLQNATATVERTFSYDLSSTQTPTALFPYRTFRPGDWVLIPGDSGLERVRVSQVGISRSSEGTTATITVGDIIPSGVAATARKLAQAGGGAIPGGTMGSPAPLSSAIPASPANPDAVSTGYWDETGAPKSSVLFSWSAVTESVAGTSILVDLYEVWTRPNLGSPWTLTLISTDTSGDLIALDLDQNIDFRVRARSLEGVYGEYSDVVTATTLPPTSTLDPADIADLYTDGVGNIFVTWAGLLDGVAYPPHFAYVVAETSTDGGATYVSTGTPITAAGTVVVNVGVWGDYLVRLRAYDRLGNPGSVGTAEAIELEDPHVSPETPKAPTGLGSTPGASWDASGFSPEAWFDLSWTAVTEDLNNDPISIVGYDVWGSEAGGAFRFLTASATNSARVYVGNAEEWSFAVRASSAFGGLSSFSTSVSDVADATIEAAAAPAAPVLSQYAGLLRITWAGTGMMPSIKYVYAAISTSGGGTYTRAGMPLNGPGEVVVPGLATGVTYYAKIVMVDELGQTSTSAASAGLLLDPITGITVQTSPVANTGIKMTTSSLTSYNSSGEPTFILDAETGEVWIAPYAAVFELGASGTEAETGDPTTGIAISSDDSSFNTFIHPSGVQIRNDQTALSWWEADAADASLVNFFSPRAVFEQRLRMGDYEFVREAKTTGTRLVIRYKGA